MKTPEEIQKITHKFLLGSPAYFVGSFIGDTVSLEHAFYEKPLKRMFSYHVLKFETSERTKIVMGTVENDYTPFGEIASQMLTVLYGKLILPIGFTETQNRYHVPDAVDFSVFDKNFPFYSDTPRAEFPIKLERHVIKEISLNKMSPLLINASRIYQKALSSFMTNPDTAYIDLVTAGEIITSEFTPKNSGFYGDEGSKIIEFLSANGEEGQQSIKYFERQNKLKRKYIEGLSEKINRDVFSEEGKPMGLTSENLIDAVAASYDLRSKYLHEGFAISSHVKFEHFEVGLTHRHSYSSEIKKILAKAPSFICLERIIRFALLKSFFNVLGQPINVPSLSEPISF